MAKFTCAMLVLIRSPLDDIRNQCPICDRLSVECMPWKIIGLSLLDADKYSSVKVVATIFAGMNVMELINLARFANIFFKLCICLQRQNQMHRTITQGIKNTKLQNIYGVAWLLEVQMETWVVHSSSVTFLRPRWRGTKFHCSVL